MKVAFFDTKPYDIPGFEKCIENKGITIKFYEAKLCPDTVQLAEGYDAVCIFVNDTVNEEVVDKLYGYGVKLIALRCAGYNNVDIKHCYGKIHVVHVPEYSPYAVAEHTMAMLLALVRRIHKAYNRTREFNFSLNGFTGFDLHGKLSAPEKSDVSSAISAADSACGRFPMIRFPGKMQVLNTCLLMNYLSKATLSPFIVH